MQTLWINRAKQTAFVSIALSQEGCQMQRLPLIPQWKMHDFRERSFIYEARSIVGRGYGIKVVLLMRYLTDTLKNIWTQFGRTKCAKRQLEASEVKFCGLVNFLFAFGKAKSNAECTGQQKSDSFTTDKLCAGSPIALLCFSAWTTAKWK